MLVDLFPRAHARFLSLPLLGAQIQASLSGLAHAALHEIQSEGVFREHPPSRSCCKRTEFANLGTSRARSCCSSPRPSPATIQVCALWFVR